MNGIFTSGSRIIKNNEICGNAIVNVKRVCMIIWLNEVLCFLSHSLSLALFLNPGWKCAQFSVPQGLFGWVCGGEAPFLCDPGSSCRNLYRHLCRSELSSA